METRPLRKLHATDVSDDEWAFLAPYVILSVWPLRCSLIEELLVPLGHLEILWNPRLSTSALASTGFWAGRILLKNDQRISREVSS